MKVDFLNWPPMRFREEVAFFCRLIYDLDNKA